MTFLQEYSMITRYGIADTVSVKNDMTRVTHAPYEI